jgi:hypothetical protein
MACFTQRYWRACVFKSTSNLPIEATILENCNVVGNIPYRGDVAWGP